MKAARVPVSVLTRKQAFEERHLDLTASKTDRLVDEGEVQTSFPSCGQYRRKVGHAASCPAGSTARTMMAAVFWIRSHDALIPAIASSPPPAHVATYPNE